MQFCKVDHKKHVILFDKNVYVFFGATAAKI